MAVTSTNGLGGNVSLPTGFNGKFSDFDYSIDIPEQVTTGFDDGGFVTADPVGPIRMTGTVNGITEYDATNTTPFPDALADGSGMALGDLKSNAQGTVTLTITTGCTLAATANITNFSGSRSHSETSSSWSYASSGAITKAWDETA